MSKHLIIIGGGAAGFFCAINASRRNPDLNITILEKHHKVLQKVKVSGGGRCNVTNACPNQSAFVKKYPRGKSFLKKIFSIFSNNDTVEWFHKAGVELKAEPDGRMFPTSNTSQTVIDCLLHEVSKGKIKLLLNTEVVYVEKHNTVFQVGLKNHEVLKADFVFVSTGGFSKSSHYLWLEALGHKIIPPVPSLFTFNLHDSSLIHLMGLSVEHALVKIEATKYSESGPLLITHWGLSGPAILKLSAWGARDLFDMNYDFNVVINWIGIPENKLREDWNRLRNHQGINVLGNKNPFAIPSRLWHYFLDECDIPSTTKWSELPSKAQNKLIHILTTHTLHVKGKTTFKEEFVIAGGVDLEQIDHSTMQSTIVPNLFFGGEVINVDGITGGFNFQNAWATGYVAALGICNTDVISVIDQLHCFKHLSNRHIPL